MSLYAESSAVLSWLLDEKSSKQVADEMQHDSDIYASELTFVECRRALRRRTMQGEDTQDDQSGLLMLESTWSIMPLASTIVRRAGEGFPIESIRTLDALHLATALDLTARFPAVRILSLDERLRQNAQALGFEVVP
jgi:predicted nucleic acid-binding protein